MAQGTSVKAEGELNLIVINRWHMSVREKELAWYRKHGKYKNSRIVKDANDNDYVIGDFSWNNKKENKNRQEYCEPGLPCYMPYWMNYDY